MKFPPFADLDKDQKKVYVESPPTGALLITGPPGTGKTVIAMHRALRLASDERPVAVIMFSKVLSRYTSNFEGMPRNVHVDHANHWFRAWFEAAFGKKNQLFDRYHNPNWKKIHQAIVECDEIDILKKLCWGHLIIDEGQDFPPTMYRSLMAVIRHKLIQDDEKPTLTVFADENQTIKENNSSIVELIEELNATVQTKRLWRLDKNYRNSTEIARFSKHFQVRGSSSVKLPERETLQPPSIVVHLDVDSPYDQIARFTTNLGNLEVGVIVFGGIQDVLYSYTSINRRVRELGLDCLVQGYVSRAGTEISNVDKLAFDSPPSITVVHSQSAKGLEFDAVFLLNLNALNPRDDGELDSFKRLYVASSRARDYLFILVAGSLEEKFMPDSMRLLPDPTAGVCDFLHINSGEVDMDVLLDLVDWCDSAYQYQRSKLLGEGMIDFMMQLENSVLISELEALATRTFYQQATATIIADRINSKEDLIDLVIELGPDLVASTLSFE